jgi:hypothetical protein
MRPRAGSASTGDTMCIKTSSIVASVTGGATAAALATLQATAKQDSLQNTTNAKAANLSIDSLLLVLIKIKTDSLTNLRASYLDTINKYLNATITSRSKPNDTMNISLNDSMAIKRDSRIYSVDTVFHLPAISVAVDTNVLHMRHKLDSIMLDSYGFVIADMYALNGTLSGGTVTSKRINFQVDTIYGGKVNTDSLIIGKYRTPSSSLDSWGSDGLMLFDTSYVYMKRGVWRRSSQSRW